MISLVLGGVRSGKSRYAVEQAEKSKKKTAFIATCVFFDKEMRNRIRLHRLSRPRHWRLIEEGRDIALALSKIENSYGIAIIDCLGLWISNLLSDYLKDNEIENEIEKFIRTILKTKLNVILVSNDVGSGIMPINAIARRFCDLLGLANQRIAQKADNVILMSAGIPQILKGDYPNAKIE